MTQSISIPADLWIFSTCCACSSTVVSTSTSAFAFLPVFVAVSMPLCETPNDVLETLTDFAVFFAGAFFVVFVTADVVEVAALAFAARRAGTLRIFFRGEGGLSVAFARARVTAGIVVEEKPENKSCA